jgi:hypothetical protein
MEIMSLDIKVAEDMPVQLFISEITSSAAVYGIDNLNIVRDTLTYGSVAMAGAESPVPDNVRVRLYDKEGEEFSIVLGYLDLLSSISSVGPDMAKNIMKLTFLRIYTLYTNSSMRVYSKFVEPFYDRIGMVGDVVIDEIIEYIDKYE